MKIISMLSLPLFFIASCSNDYAAVPASPAMSIGKATVTERKVTKTGSLSMKSHSLKESSEKSVRIIRSHQGVLHQASLDENEYEATIRVPSQALEPMMADLEEIGKVTRRRISQDDVTRQYFDLQAKIKNQTALRDRLRVLLSQSQKVSDTLKIETELARVQTELDQLTRQHRTLASKVTLSTLHFSIERKRTPGPLGLVTQGTSWVAGKLFYLN